VFPLYFLALLLVCLGSVAFRRRPSAARGLYRAALLLAAVPYLMHVRYTWGWVSGFGDPQPRIGVYPGLVAFAAAGVIITVGLVSVAWALVPRMALATAALPATLWLAYWYGSLRLVYWQMPDFVPIDNKPLVWLFASSAFATIVLALAASVAVARPASAHRSSSPASDRDGH